MLNFPDTPTLNQTFSSPNGTFLWDGGKWIPQGGYGYAPPAGNTGGFLPLSGGTMTGPLIYTATGGNTTRSAQDRAAEPFSVRDFGAIMDGTTSDQTPLTNAFAATPALGVITIPPGNINPGTFAPTSKPMLWRCAGTYTGSGTLTLGTIGNSVVETMYGTWSKYFNRGSSVGITSLGAVLRTDMTLNHTGGTTGGVAALDVNAFTTAASTLNEAPMAVSGRLTMSSTKVGAQVGVAVFGSSVKASGAGNGSPFGANFLADDQTGLSSVNAGSAVGAEIDLKANKLDDGTLADGFNNAGSGSYPGSQRVVLALQYGRSNRSDNTAMEVASILQMGLFSTAIDGAYCSAKNGIKLQGPVSFAGLNFLHATFNANAQAIALQNEQTIGWTADPLTGSPTNWRTLGYTTSGTDRLRYMVGTSEVWSISDNGTVTIPGPLIYTATGGTTARAAQDRAADWVHVRDFGAVFDGNSHPLSNYYATLAAAQAVYPFATALTNEIDGVAIQAAINYCQANVANFSFGGTVILPCDNGRINTPLVISKQNVSLRSQGYGFILNSNVSRATPSAPTRLTWTGPAATAGQFQTNMLTVAPTDGGRLLTGCNVEGILFYINGIAGVAGPLIASLRYASIDCATYEPAGVPYPGCTVTAGSQAVTISSTAGLRVGESVVSANFPGGAYVMSITDGTHFNASMQAIASATETVTIGGEGIRFDVVDNLTDSNDTQFLRVRFVGINLLGAANATAPLVMIGGSSINGSTGSHHGNTSLNWFDDIEAHNNNGHGVVINNSDHNFHQNITGQHIGAGSGRLLILNGSLDPNNGPARYHLINHSGDGGLHAGTDTGGFTTVATANTIVYLDRQNAAPLPVFGVGAYGRVGADNQPVLSFSNSTVPIVAQMPDSAIAGGNTRGANAVDLQTGRTAAAMVASGNQAVIAGGSNNTASAQYAAVLGGSINNASSLGSVILGGTSNLASQNYAIAMGNAASSDLYGAVTISLGTIASGRRTQTSTVILRGISAANTTPVRLTGDLGAAGAANTVNLTYSNSVYALWVQLVAVDSTNSNNFYVWNQPLGLLRRNGGVGTTVYVPGTPTSLSNGTTTGIAITEAADTTNAGYSLTFTPPTSNTAIWRIAATIELTRMDAA